MEGRAEGEVFGFAGLQELRSLLSFPEGSPSQGMGTAAGESRRLLGRLWPVLIFHGWVIYLFYSAACTTGQAALCASLQALARWQRDPADPCASPSPSRAEDVSHHRPPCCGTICVPSPLPTAPSPWNEAAGWASRTQTWPQTPILQILGEPVS